MAPQTSVTQNRLNNLIAYLRLAVSTLVGLESAIGTPFLTAIANTTLSLLNGVENVKNKKAECVQLLEHVHGVLYAIISLHITSDTGGVLAPTTLEHIGKFTETLQKIHAFVESQQEGNKIKQFLRQSETNSLLKDCNLGLQQAIDVFKIQTGASLLVDIEDMQKSSEETHNALLELISTLSDGANSDRLSSITGSLSDSRNSLNSFSLLPGKPKIFHGRESELEQIVKALALGSAKIAILGAGGMGKTSLARAALHHPEIAAKYQNTVFIPTDSVTTGTDLASLVASHLGLKPGKKATKTILDYFSNSPPSLLILDNLETSWEAPDSRKDVEEFLSCLTDVQHLSLLITMRGAERPAKVQWTHPFLPPLKPLSNEAAHKIFTDIADGFHDPSDIKKLLLFTDNVPLAVDLIAHLVDYEGSPTVLSRWETEKTSLLSDGFDRKSNLDISITVSLLGSRMTSSPGAMDLLSLLSILPDGLSDSDLIQSGLPIPDILACKATLLRTSLGYIDYDGHLKSLSLIREHVFQFHPPLLKLIHPLRRHFHLILKLYVDYIGSQPSAKVVARVTSNLGNIQNILLSGFHSDGTDLKDTIECTLYLHNFRRFSGHGRSGLMDHIPDALAKVQDPQLWTHFITLSFNAWGSDMTFLTGNSENMIVKAQEQFLNFSDPAAEAQFYNGAGFYVLEHDKEPLRAKNFFERAITLSQMSGKSHEQCYALIQLSWIERGACHYSAALTYARKSHKLAKISGNLLDEARALRVQAVVCVDLGLYPDALSLCHKGRELLCLCGLSFSIVDLILLGTEAEIYGAKSEYTEARTTHTEIIQRVDQSQYTYAISLFSIASIDVLFNPDAQMKQNINSIYAMFSAVGNTFMQTYCDELRAELYLAQRNFVDAKALLQKCLNLSWGKDYEIVDRALYRLSDSRHWEPSSISQTSQWTVIFLVHALKLHKKLQTHEALRCLGDVFLHLNDEDTAFSLFTLGLEGFTQMDVHSSRGDCMLRLGDIAKHRGDLVHAVKLWKEARPLFERSSQAKDMVQIDTRLALIENTHQETLALLGKLDTPTTSLDVLSMVKDTV